MDCRHVLIGKAELDAMEASLTAWADTVSAQADRIFELERAVLHHKSAVLLADTQEQVAAADERLWGVLDA